jgi:MFS family permease
MRRLLLLVSAIVLVDTMFYAAITPLLPYYAHRLDLSKGAAGILAAAYPAGALVGALPGGWLAARAGVRPAVLIGLGLLAASSLVFGFANHAALLDAARFVQGLGGAASWAGGLSWLVGRAPAERRGEMIGNAFGAALGGALFGPVLGAAARGIGPKPVFTAVAALAVLLAAAVVREPAPRAAGEQPTAREQVRALRDPRVAGGGALILLVGLLFGVIDVLAPLRLDHLGASGAVVGGVFLVTAGAEALLSPVYGRWSDRVGPMPLVRGGLIGGVAVAALLPWPDSAGVLAVLVILAGPAVGALWVPAMSAISAGAEAQRLEQGYAFAVVNAAWAVSQMIGSAAGSRLAQATADAVPYLIVSALFGAALAATLRRVRRVPSRA